MANRLLIILLICSVPFRCSTDPTADSPSQADDEFCPLNPKKDESACGKPTEEKISTSNSNRLTMSNVNERTFIMVKPDGVQRGVVGEVIRRFEQRGYKLVGLKMIQAPRALLESHYEEHKGKKFYEPLLSYVGSGPVVATVWEGLNVINVGRKILGATDPAKAEPGTIRGDFGIVTGRNIAHGSDSESAAQREINLWFRADEVTNWPHTAERWIYE